MTWEEYALGTGPIVLDGDPEVFCSSGIVHLTCCGQAMVYIHTTLGTRYANGMVDRVALYQCDMCLTSMKIDQWADGSCSIAVRRYQVSGIGTETLVPDTRA